MKKQKIIAFFIVLSSIASVFGAYESIKTESFKIQAGFGEISEVYVTEIPAQGSAFLEGMPFNIEDIIVRFSNGGRGRTIAHFDVVSNSNCKISVQAADLKWESNPEDPNQSGITAYLSYILTFDYNVAYTTASGTVEYSPEDTSFSINSGGNKQSVILYTGEEAVSENSYLSIMDGSISFMFNEETSDKIHNTPDEVPVGTYKGNVTITLEDI